MGMLAAALLAVGVLSSCGSSPGGEARSSGEVPSSSSAAGKTTATAAAVSASSSASPAVELKTYTDGEQRVSFDYPAGWSVQDSQENLVHRFHVLDAAGAEMVTLTYPDWTMHTCQGMESMSYELLDSVPVELDGLPAQWTATVDTQTVDYRNALRPVLAERKFQLSVEVYARYQSAAYPDTHNSCRPTNGLFPLDFSDNPDYQQLVPPPEAGSFRYIQAFPDQEAADAFLKSDEYRQVVGLLSSLRILP